MNGFDRSRRRALAGLAALAAAPLATRAGWAQQTADQGIGGTGAAPDHPGDQGIGGTGVIGTIRRFGSIVVNDLRIGYPRDVAVTLDGRAASAGALRLGHVVRVLTEGERQLSTRHIAVLHEVVGRIERVGPGHLTILGQSVAIDDIEGRAWRVGAWAAVSGLRGIDGTIQASLVEPSRRYREQISGPVVRQQDGALAIGDLRLDGIDPSLVGERATVMGALQDAVFVATTSQSEASILAALSDRLSIEALVQRSGDRLVVGSGLQVDPPRNLADLAESVVHRAVLHATAGDSGRLVVDSVRLERSNGRSSGRGAAPGSESPPRGPGSRPGARPAEPHNAHGASGSNGDSRHGPAGSGTRGPGSRPGRGPGAGSR